MELGHLAFDSRQPPLEKLADAFEFREGVQHCFAFRAHISDSLFDRLVLRQPPVLLSSNFR